MKHPFRLPLLTAAALCLATFASSSCASFTKDDAKELGAFVAEKSLDIAQAYATGGEVDFKLAAYDLGFDVAGLALKKVQKNLAADSLSAPAANPFLPVVAANPDQIVEDALRQATDQLNAQMGADPVTTTLAIRAAETAIAKALDTLSAPPKSSAL